MWLRTLLSIAVICLAVQIRVRAAEPAKIIPQEWLPALAPAIQAALDDLKEADSQAAMNTLSRHVADMTDAQLFVAYIRLYERLSPSQRDALLDEQTRWLARRSKVASDAVESKGGSLAPLEENNAELTYTEKRLVELRARLKALGSKSSATSKSATADDDEESSPKKKKKSSADDGEAKPKAKKKSARKSAAEDDE
jgi:uncharacterized protein YecT (DUF1311 family)